MTSRAPTWRGCGPMTEGTMLADSSVLIDSLHPHRGARAKARMAELALADQVGVWGLIIGEVLIGARTEREYHMLADELEGFHYLTAPDDVWLRAARLGFELRRTGRTVPLTDLAVAVVAMYHDVPVVHMDRDFIEIAKVCDLEQEYVEPADEE